MSTDTPTAERDVVAAIAALLLGRVNAPEPEIYRASRDIVTLARTTLCAMERAEITRLRAELEQARAFEMLVREYLGECEAPVPDINYRITLRERIRAALYSSPGESAKESAAPSASEADHG